MKWNIETSPTSTKYFVKMLFVNGWDAWNLTGWKVLEPLVNKLFYTLLGKSLSGYWKKHFHIVSSNLQKTNQANVK